MAYQHLFYAKSCLYIYIKYTWFVNEYVVGKFLNKSKIICLHIVKWFKVLLTNIVNSI